MRLHALAAAIGARLDGPDDPEVQGVAELPQAGPGDLAALFEPRWRRFAAGTRAAAAVVTPALADLLPPGCARLVCEDARDAWGRALRALFPGPEIALPPPGVDPRAAVDPSATIAADARVGPFCFVGPGAVVAEGAALCAGAYVGAGARIGPGAVLHPHAVVLDRCVVGAGARLGSGAVVGSPGFGLDAAGRVPQVGIAVIEDAVTLGAHTCVDRATVGETRVGAGSHLDNLVQVGHNARVGRGAVLCGQVGVAGGAVIDDGAVLGGQAGVNGHVTVGARARVAAQAGVTKSLPAGGEYSGHPAEPNRERLRREARLRRLVTP
jgi:UDP-3-O-[3-hydroxymyristoyl] glucosamine N-acyltransferase